MTEIKRGFEQRNHLDDYHPSCNHPSGVNHALTVHFSFCVRNSRCLFLHSWKLHRSVKSIQMKPFV